MLKPPFVTNGQHRKSNRVQLRQESLPKTIHKRTLNIAPAIAQSRTCNIQSWIEIRHAGSGIKSISSRKRIAGVSYRYLPGNPFINLLGEYPKINKAMDIRK
jgi:hypothetical protein